MSRRRFPGAPVEAPDHFLVTRFNVRRSGADDDRRHVDPAWLADRIDLFDRWCRPSVAAARHERLRWLVLLDDETPDSAREKLTELAEGAFEPVWLDSPLDDELHARIVTERAATDRVVTTRLDSDDAVAPGMLASSYRLACERRDVAVTFPVGYQVAGHKAYLRVYVQNPFISLEESTEGCRTVYGLSHFDLRGERLVVGGTRPSWVQLVHGGNLANEVRGVRVAGRGAGRVLREAGAPDLQVAPVREWLPESARGVAWLVGAGARALPRLARLRPAK